ncbi:helix-turn-helix domain-containing protein [Streptomyces cadmiisoli]|uniref:helix-turn-helix domain-containing protein n=1 Tax=Streptomyces cadmiisoli TaxID=2184053 RepID=UPI0036669C08
MNNRNARTEEDTTTSRIVGRNIKRLRTARGLSGRRLAALVQERGFRFNHSSLSRMELGINAKGGQRAVTVDELVAVASVFGVEPQELLTEPKCVACFDAPPLGFACRSCGAAA